MCFVALALALDGEVPPEGLALPLLGAGIGAGIGALIPGKRTLLYAAPVSNWASLGLAPDAGRGRRGVAVRVAF